MPDESSSATAAANAAPRAPRRGRLAAVVGMMAGLLMLLVGVGLGVNSLRALTMAVDRLTDQPNAFARDEMVALADRMHLLMNVGIWLGVAGLVVLLASTALWVRMRRLR